MKIPCTVEYVDDMEDDAGAPCRQGVVVTCSECEHCTESFGQGPASVKRCLALLREECPEGGDNYYVDENE